MKVNKRNQVAEVPVRDSVQVHLPDGRVLEGRRGTHIEEFLKQLTDLEAPVVGAVVDWELRELTYSILTDVQVRPVTMAEPDGMRIYRRSLTFLLAAAFDEVFPGVELYVDHSVSSGGYFCRVSDRAPLDEDELSKLEKRMRSMVEEDIPFAKMKVPLQNVIEYFEAKGYSDKARLLAHRRKPHLVLYALGDLRDYYHGYMVPSTSYLKWFRLAKIVDGFTLCFPRRHHPTDLHDPPQYPTLLTTFRLYGDWLTTLGISSVGAMNDAIVAGMSRKVVLVSEALHERQIAEIAAQIYEERDTLRVVLIAGPSSSGKTTFSKRLSIQLLALGLSPLPIGIDNFFVDREKTPRDEKGEYDFETIEALDLERLNHDLFQLIDGKQVQLPKYDFLTGKQQPGDEVELHQGEIIILEGIHGLNPDLLPQIAREQTFRIYASALTQLNLDRFNRVSTTDTRLLRRIVRDAKMRGYDALDTIRRWESVRRGEKEFIFPYQENADMMFNSALVYEASALAPLAEPLLRQVPYRTVEHIEAKRLLTFLEWILPIETKFIPDNSIMREFIGGSILEHFTPWRSP
jgi:uridine kinase